MWLKWILLTLVSILITLQQMNYWRKNGTRKQSLIFLLWMIIAWGVGCAYIGGLHLPEPTKPIFPAWK
ncbi:hypothetical protein A8709_10100 [Paenibacillus pectinilyticus]|uniref:Uncharacterized protein n=1 Tax=Paenibacillus pectinilyticus TaxID=512399 RepID=A0A1C1A5Y0_9BACL|nr:hypothetical protein [Paenibacillus pectinilyticus]OCT15963.1 hypothetical protein A8709_10100 [Paenibacillus pectinilyticus]